MRVKICGITNLADAIMTVDLGAWALGFNFYRQSPRYISPASAAHIIHQLPSEIVTVGVFVNASASYIFKVQQLTGIHMVQLHGDETPDTCKQIRGPVIKAIRNKNDILTVSYAYLIDAEVSEQFGGTGVHADWFFAREVAKKYPTILAGGLNAENIREAISVVNPEGIDLCSGVELSPGKKSREKMVSLFEALV
jgi:phosphoribosylanthranilate isomerase